MISEGPSGHNPFLHKLEHGSTLQFVVLKLRLDGQYEPFGHAVHVVAELAPVMGDTVPCAHNEGASEPVKQNAPAGQFSQSPSFDPKNDDLKVPPGQGKGLEVPRKQ